MTFKKKILFVSHDASLTGAPILLLNLVKLLKEEDTYSIKIIVKNEWGVLLDDFKHATETVVWHQQSRPTLYSRIKKKLFPATQEAKKNDKLIQRWIDESDVVFSNTITNGDFFKAFDFSTVPLTVSYVHELEFTTYDSTTPQDIFYVISKTNKFLVPAKAVARHLITNLKIDEQKISLLNYYIPFKVAGNVIQDDKDKIFTVGLIGTLYWRKGADILCIIAAIFFKKYPGAQLRFVWKGGNTKSIEWHRINYELTKLQLNDKVLFESPSTEVGPFYQSIDVLLLSSKEDPYPLVVLEAASYSKPCICFSDAGGAPEFVQDDAGDVVPYLDIENLADSIYSYYINREKGISKGAVAYSRYQQLHFNKKLIVEQLLNTLNA